MSKTPVEEKTVAFGDCYRQHLYNNNSRSLSLNWFLDCSFLATLTKYERISSCLFLTLLFSGELLFIVVRDGSIRAIRPEEDINVL
jgi:hypothetical protein